MKDQAEMFEMDPIHALKPWQGGPAPFDRHVDGLPPAIRFDGETYAPPIDADRLGAQAKAVFHLMQDGAWHTLAEISYATGYPEASISARLRDFRKRKFGASRVDRRRLTAGLWEYRLIVQRADLRTPS